MIEVKVSDPKTFKQKIKQANHLHRDGVKVAIVVNDEIFKHYDADAIAELLDKGVEWVDYGT